MANWQRLPRDVDSAITALDNALQLQGCEQHRCECRGHTEQSTAVTEARKALRVAIHRALGNQPDQGARSSREAP